MFHTLFYQFLLRIKKSIALVFNSIFSLFLNSDAVSRALWANICALKDANQAPCLPVAHLPAVEVTCRDMR